MSKAANKYLRVDSWSVIEEDFHAEQSLVSESIFSIANEYMGVRGYFEEGYSGNRLPGSYFNGVWSEIDIKHPVMYKGLASKWTFMVNSVDWLYTRIKLDGETLDLATSKFSGFARVLDLKRGIYTRELIWETDKGKLLKIKFTRFTSMVIPNLGGQQISFEALNFSGPVEVETALDFSNPHQSIDNRNYWNIESFQFNSPWTAMMGRAHESNILLYSAFRIETLLEHESTCFNDQKITGQKFSLELNKGKTLKINKLVINYSDKKVNGNSDHVWSRGQFIADNLTNLTFEKAINDHADYWKKIWPELDVTIDGDPETQQGIRFCIFQLHQTNHGQDPHNNVGAKGLTGEIYSGHTFWDTEAYCLPFYLFTNPAAAKNLLLFRHKTLSQAKEWSIEQNCLGACYPMETIDGRESCPVWWHGNLEIHVSGAVGYGIWHYYRITGDEAFLYREGIEMLVEICRFFASRGNWREDGYGFYGVMGPDEFHTFVNNNYYTNLLAKKLFQFTTATLALAGEKIIIDNLPGQDETDEWKRMADKMILPENEKTGVFEQHEGYFLLPHLDISSIPAEEFPLYHSWTLPRIYRYDMIKQPDVLLALLFFSHDYSPSQKKVNYGYYEPRCIHESSLSPSVHSIIAAETGRKKEAENFFEYATRLDLDNYNRNTAEGLHITSMAAAWSNIVYGFGGMRSDGETLSFNPSIPGNWKMFSFAIKFRGAKIFVEVTRDKALFRITEGKGPVVISVNQSAITLTGEPHEVCLT
jgi:maltose phosphorylase